MAEEKKKNILTYAGLQKLEDELNDLRMNKRKEISQKIKEAMEQGDISENAEYDAAKNEQAEVEARIEELQDILKNAEVVVESEASIKTVGVGCHIKILDMDYDEELEYDIVGSIEASSRANKLSNESPVGMALMGAKKNDVVTVSLPDGDAHFKVLKISRNA
ncbi:MAG: transcription elongation factor GreA [Lachnospiraceae bacterium]|nr:transcription elongation factor GreA [Lachnospiraceae bacterium]